MPRLLLVSIFMLIFSGCAVTKVTESGLDQPVQGDAQFPALLKYQPELFALQNRVDDKLENVWDRIRTGFTLPYQNHIRVERQLKWYASHPEYMNRVAERARPYMHYIIETLEANKIPSELALLPIVESAFKPFAYSHGRASGIWQFIPSTGKRFGLKQNWWYDGRRDVYAATQSAVKLLNNLSAQFKGDWMLALAAYNSGSGTVKKAIRRNKLRGKPTDFWSLDLPKETRAYVPKLLALKEIIMNPQQHGISLQAIPNEPYFDVVDVGSQIDLAMAAELAEIELEELYQLNPGYNRWATSPNGPHYLLLPVDKADTFNERLAEIPAAKRIKWIRHRIRDGETLSTIANRYHVSTSTIKRMNSIRGSFLKAGRSLTIPVASQSLRKYTLSANQRQNKLQNTPRKGVKVTHIVQAGDTFWDLARTHRVGVRQLARWNGMAPTDRLSQGQRLVIWSRTGKTISHNDVMDIDIPARDAVTQRIGYRVRNGDSLARIADKFRVSISQLKRWNKKLSLEKYLQPGQHLTLFVDVMKQSGT